MAEMVFGFAFIVFALWGAWMWVAVLAGIAGLPLLPSVFVGLLGPLGLCLGLAWVMRRA